MGRECGAIELLLQVQGSRKMAERQPQGRGSPQLLAKGRENASSSQPQEQAVGFGLHHPGGASPEVKLNWDRRKRELGPMKA